MYFTPLLISDVKKGPYLIIENRYWLQNSKVYYFGEFIPPHLPQYTTLNAYYYNKGWIKLPNLIQLETPSLTFFKCIPTIVPKLRQRMLNQILRKITGDESFSYSIFEPEELHYQWKDEKLTNILFPVPHVKG
jgi:hypothetical protein